MKPDFPAQRPPVIWSEPADTPEDTLMDGESYLIMDLVARTDDGAIVNVEIQKQGYDFPGQRMSCYASDLLLRQYIKTKKMPDHSAHDFSYKSEERL